MSMKAIIVVVTLAFGLLVVAFFANRAQVASPTPAGTDLQLFDFKPAQVTKIVVTGEGRTHAVVRDDDLGWSYLTPTGETWPASPSERELAALGRFSGLTALNAAPDQSLPDAPSRIQIELDDGTTRTLRFAHEALGGKILADAGTGVHLVESADVLPLASPGPRSWRATVALPGARDASRLTLESKASAIRLAKLGGDWTVRSPVSHRANEQAVASLLDILAQLQITRFVDDDPPSPGDAGLVSPRLTITHETDIRTVDDEGRTRTSVRARALIIGNQTDTRGETLFAAPSPRGELLMAIPADLITMISTAPRNYLALTATDLPAEEIGLVTVTTGYAAERQRGFRRSRGVWSELMPDGAEREMDGNAVTELVDFLRTEPGEPEPSSTDRIAPAGKVTLHDTSGRPLETIAFAYTADGTPFARVGNVDVLYYDFAPPRLLPLPPASETPAPWGEPSFAIPDGARSTK